MVDIILSFFKNLIKQGIGIGCTKTTGFTGQIDECLSVNELFYNCFLLGYIVCLKKRND